MAIVVKKQKLSISKNCMYSKLPPDVGDPTALFTQRFNTNALPTLNYPEEKRALAPNYRGFIGCLKKKRASSNARPARFARNLPGTLHHR